jgi:hypothetical protein
MVLEEEVVMVDLPLEVEVEVPVHRPEEPVEKVEMDLQ